MENPEDERAPQGGGDEPDRATRLRELVARCIERLDEAGERGLEALLAEHSELAAEARARLARLRGIGLLGGDVTGDEPPFERLGGFRLLRRLGSGGMGVVYLAEEEALGRRVALKLLRPELVWFPGARERMRREAAATARLVHPGIVPVHAMGEDGGVPWLSMELVTGSTLSQTLAALAPRSPADLSGRDLFEAVLGTATEKAGASVAGDASLFSASWSECCCRLALQVAEALEHAHRRGVVHRDVKPSNVMVSPAGRVMLVDFGLARAAGTDSLTRTGTELGSLPYMPPEQVRGEPADAKSDVYSLGATLYEMLALRPPFAAAGSEELRRAILAGRPAPLRRFHPSIPWDVETVCLAALEAERERRYPSASELARDLANVLAHRPIEARRPGWIRRTRGWTRRHPARAVGLVLALVVVVVGPSVLLWQERAALARIRAERDAAEEQRLRAEANYERAVEAVERMLARVAERRLRHEPRADPLARELLEDALGFHLEFLAESEHDPRRRYEAGVAWERVARIRHLLGEDEEAAQSAREALALLEPLADEEHERARHRAALASALQALGSSLRASGSLEGSTEAFERAVALREERGGRDAATEDEQRELAAAHNGLGGAFEARSDLVRAEQEFRRALELQAEITRGPDAGAHDRFVLAGYRRNTALLLQRQGRHAEAAELLREGVEQLGPLVEAHPGRTDFREELAQAGVALGTSLIALGRASEGSDALFRAADELARLVAEHPDRPSYHSELGLAEETLGRCLQRLGRLEDAIAHMARAVELDEALPDEHAARLERRKSSAMLRNNLGSAFHAAGRISEAEQCFRDALARMEEVVLAEPGNGEARSELARFHHNLAWTLENTGRGEPALEHHRRALALREALFAEDPQRGSSATDLASTLSSLGRLGKDEALLERALELREELARRSPEQPKLRAAPATTLENLAALHLERGDEERAEEELWRALALRAEVVRSAPDQPALESALATTEERLASLLLRRGGEQLGEARALIESAVLHQRAAVQAAPGSLEFKKCLAGHLTVLEAALSALGEGEAAAAAAAESARLAAAGPGGG